VSMGSRTGASISGADNHGSLWVIASILPVQALIVTICEGARVALDLVAAPAANEPISMQY
jgi:hypothetical protein